MMEVYFVTTNKNKFMEVGEILGHGFRLKQMKIEIPEIQALDVKEIVKDKVMKAYDKARKPVMVEDTALYIKSWNGFPGPLVAWVVKTMGIAMVCKLAGPDRSAMAEACVAYYDGNTLKLFSGSVDGKISRKPRGKKRFDWDRIFVPSGFSKTFAEMTMEEKNRISHRMKAFAQLKKYLYAGNA